MAKQLSPVPRLQFVDPNGKPYAFGFLSTYAAGTLTPQATFADSAGTPNPTTITLDAAGSAVVYLGTAGYKFQLFDSANNLIFTQDNILSNYIDATTAQTLSNKTLDDTSVIAIKDSNFTIESAAGATSLIRFSAAGITAGQTRVVTVPDQSIKMAGQDLKNVFTARQEWGQGANIASANNLVLGADGNTFEITGVTQINAIDATNWTAGSIVVLTFASALTLKNNTTGGAGTQPMLLQGAQDYAVQSGDVVVLQFQNLGAGGFNWVEISRSYHTSTDRNILTTQITLTNAQILALPTTEVVVIAAPGSGQFIQILNWAVKVDLTHAVYTNVDPTAKLILSTDLDAWVAQAASAGIFNSSAAVILAHLTGGNDASNPVPFSAYSNFNGRAIAVGASNAALGNFTGGDPANSMVIYVTYQVRTS